MVVLSADSILREEETLHKMPHARNPNSSWVRRHKDRFDELTEIMSVRKMKSKEQQPVVLEAASVTPGFSTLEPPPRLVEAMRVRETLQMPRRAAYGVGSTVADASNSLLQDSELNMDRGVLTSSAGAHKAFSRLASQTLAGDGPAAIRETVLDLALKDPEIFMILTKAGFYRHRE